MLITYVSDGLCLKEKTDSNRMIKIMNFREESFNKCRYVSFCYSGELLGALWAVLVR